MMEEIQVTKSDIRRSVLTALEHIPEDTIQSKTREIEQHLFEFANFLEATIVLMYVNSPGEVDTQEIIKKCYDFNKMVVLPSFQMDTFEMALCKVEHPGRDLVRGPRGILEPNPDRCKRVPIDCIDIAIVPAIALDEKGGRIGTGEGFYDRLIPDLPITTRKVALAMEDQIIAQVPMESHDKFVDIIITEERVIYKI